VSKSYPAEICAVTALEGGGIGVSLFGKDKGTFPIVFLPVLLLLVTLTTFGAFAAFGIVRVGRVLGPIALAAAVALGLYWLSAPAINF